MGLEFFGMSCQWTSSSSQHCAAWPTELAERGARRMREFQIPGPGAIEIALTPRISCFSCLNQACGCYLDGLHGIQLLRLFCLLKCICTGSSVYNQLKDLFFVHSDVELNEQEQDPQQQQDFNVSSALRGFSIQDNRQKWSQAIPAPPLLEECGFPATGGISDAIQPRTKRRSSGSSNSNSTGATGSSCKFSTDPQSVAARLRRKKISERFKTLQKLVPGGTKMDTASMLDEAITYVKFLKQQIWLHEIAVANSTAAAASASASASASAAAGGSSSNIQEPMACPSSWSPSKAGASSAPDVGDVMKIWSSMV